MTIDTKIIKIDPATDLDPQLASAAEIIRAGGLVAFPTETVYGLGADGTSATAAARIYAAKGRPSDNPLIIHISDPTVAEAYTYTNSVYYRLAAAFMPGPMTVILPARDTVPPTTRGGLSTVAVRCPENPVARTLIRLAGVPIAAPSANLSGSPSPTTAAHVIDDMMGRVDMIIDGGACEFGLESTIVKVDADGGVTLLRPGRISPDDIRSLGIEVRIADAVTDRLRDGEVALSPGMKYRHYAPSAEVLLLDGDREASLRFIAAGGRENPAVIAYTADVDFYREALPFATVIDFGSEGDELAQARSLFAILRDADKHSYSVIYAPLPRQEGIGLALYNRMIRAAAHKIIKL